MYLTKATSYAMPSTYIGNASLAADTNVFTYLPTFA